MLGQTQNQKDLEHFRKGALPGSFFGGSDPKPKRLRAFQKLQFQNFSELFRIFQNFSEKKPDHVRNQKDLEHFRKHMYRENDATNFSLPKPKKT